MAWRGKRGAEFAPIAVENKQGRGAWRRSAPLLRLRGGFVVVVLRDSLDVLGRLAALFRRFKLKGVWLVGAWLAA